MQIRKILRMGIPSLEKLRSRQTPLQKQFESIILDHLSPDSLVLDAGCGITTYAGAKGKCRMVVGVDADRTVTRNQQIDAIVHADLAHLPFPDSTFDTVMSWTVLEHIDNPQACFNELARVCKPGGIMVHSTPNLLHYANFFIKATPYAFHKWFARHIIGEQDYHYPTRYKINTPRKMARLMRQNGFKPLEIRLVDTGPVYLNWLAPAYAVGLVYHRLVNSLNFLASFRSFMIGVSIRQSPAEVGNHRE